MNDFFEQIASRYGIAPAALQNAWDKTAGSGSHEDHVKRFMVYLHKLTGEAHYGYQVPQIETAVAESIAQEFLKREFEELREAILEDLTDTEGTVSVD